MQPALNQSTALRAHVEQTDVQPLGGTLVHQNSTCGCSGEHYSYGDSWCGRHGT